MEFNPHPLKGQVAIITGASSGIGASIALLLAKAGANVVVTARRVDRLEEISGKIKALNNGVEVVVSALDVRDKAAFEKLAADTKTKFGKIDILVNNAGVMLLSFARKLKYEEWNDMVDINIKGVLNGVAAVLTIMREQKCGHIVNISSDADRKVFPGSAVYSGTKAFVSMLSEGLRMELCQEGIPVHVTSISSGAYVAHKTAPKRGSFLGVPGRNFPSAERVPAGKKLPIPRVLTAL
eukprot:TRINITY_DN1877_c0_g1_i1.p1 TRINITY_DN1877_c0_g1~~TRINITY_DN1877_c0_g1_i1.p1  ORF type:complete len:238 (-),score=51.83 TRINITY_DN1877_c0_g1_i1:83-796(-)